MWRFSIRGGFVLTGGVCLLVLGINSPGWGEVKAEPKAEQYLKQACTYLAGLKSFSFRVDESFEDIDDDGQKLQFSNRRHVSVERPNHIAMDSSGDTANRKFFYDGKTASLVDKEHNVYGVEKTPGTIDAMLEQMHEQFGYTQPLSDLYFSDPYKVLSEHVQSSKYVGVGSVGDVKCHHLAFRQQDIDWQMWIEAGDKPLIRKFIITYKREAGEPQYSAIFTHWDPSPQLASSTFEFKPPEGAHKAGFVKVHEEAASDKERPKK